MPKGSCTNARGRRLMSTPGVGCHRRSHLCAGDRCVRAAAIIEDSGETDVIGRISKFGDAGVCSVHYEAANVIAIRVAAHIRMRKAKVVWT